MPEASVTRILTTLLRVRQLEGFTFAHSKNGIQTLMIGKAITEKLADLMHSLILVGPPLESIIGVRTGASLRF